MQNRTWSSSVYTMWTACLPRVGGSRIMGYGSRVAGCRVLCFAENERQVPDTFHFLHVHVQLSFFSKHVELHCTLHRQSVRLVTSICRARSGSRVK